MHLLVFFTFLEHVGDTAFAAVVAIGMGSHEDTSTTLWSWTFPPQSLNLPIPIHLVELQHSQFGLLALVLNLLRCRVNLLLALLSTTAKSED